MCGIAGILRVYPPGQAPPPLFESIPEAWLDVLDDAIRHRGPDGQGRFRDRATRPDGSTVDVALVHRRVSILDHAGGAQPMVAPDGADQYPAYVFHGDPATPVRYEPVPAGRTLAAVAFNGCIYNHRDLREQLRALGHEFRTDHSDTEALLRACVAWGHGAFAKVNAMLAAAAWSRGGAELTLARDPFGEKPLHVTYLPEGVSAFANVPGGLLRLRRRLGARIAATTGALAGAISLGAPSWRMSFCGVETLPPGAVMVAPVPDRPHDRFDGFTTLAIHDAANTRFAPTLCDPPADPAGAVEAMLADSVRGRLDADVPLACLLSGGVDSSLVALLARRAGPLTTVCVRMPDPRYDESVYAAEVARAIGATHVDVPARADDIPGDLERLIEQMGLPFADSSLLPTHWACKAAREHATVVLGGDGGDELFLGYERYGVVRALRVLRPLAPLLRLLPLDALEGADPKSHRAKAARLARAAAGRGYPDLVSIFPSADLGRLVGTHAAHAARPGEFDPLHWDLADHFPDVLLRKADHASMAAGVELRSPFLDRELADAVLRWPVRTLTPGGQRKGLLRAVARKYLPPSIIDRPKMGFAIPIGEWFRSDHAGLRVMLLDHVHAADAFPPELLGLELNRTYLRRMLDEHDGSRRDHGQRLYMLLVLAVWCRWLRTA